ncbi:FtsW/RodA/SpoVE family cell cycle protein, partial [Elusimicrobiota bacterium]
ARRWLRFWFFGFQPSELAKLVMIIALADYLDRKRLQIKQFKKLLPLFLIIFLPAILILFQPDLGTPVVMITAGFVLMYTAGVKITHLSAAFLAILPLVIIEIIRKPYRLERMKHFFSSLGSVESTSYQINQSIMAFGSGGMLGKGLAKSQMKLFHLPEPHTDFIFPVIGEELGFIGAVALILLFIGFAWRGWVISNSTQNYFGSILALGITWFIVFQAFFNMGVATGILPVKGLPLPFVSFGGTSLFLNLAGVGILLNIAKQSGISNKLGVFR